MNDRVHQAATLLAVLLFLALSAMYPAGGVRTALFARNLTEDAGGMIVSVQKLFWGIGGENSGPHYDLYAVQYEFPARDGKRHRGVSYAKISMHSSSAQRVPQAGESVRVEYDRDNPSISRAGHYSILPGDPSPTEHLLAAALILGVLSICLWRLAGKIRLLGLARGGRIAYSNLFVITPESVGGKTRGHVLSVPFHDGDGAKHVCRTRVNYAVTPALNPEYCILYDARDPARNVLVNENPALTCIVLGGSLPRGLQGRLAFLLATQTIWLLWLWRVAGLLVLLA